MDRTCPRARICSWFASSADRRSAPTSPSARTAATACAGALPSFPASTFSTALRAACCGACAARRCAAAGDRWPPRGAALVASAVYPYAIVIGANAAALGMLAAWAAPDLRAARIGAYYEGDLLGAGALAAVLLAMPFALPRPAPSWLAGVTGGAIGLLLGLGLQRAGPDGL